MSDPRAIKGTPETSVLPSAAHARQFLKVRVAADGLAELPLKVGVLPAGGGAEAPATPALQPAPQRMAARAGLRAARHERGLEDPAALEDPMADEQSGELRVDLTAPDNSFIVAQLELPAGSAAPGGVAGLSTAPAAAPASSMPSVASTFATLGVLGLALGGGGGSSSAGRSGGTANPTPVGEQFNGTVINGYIKNALVFQDNDDDGVHDADEASDVTDSSGKFSIALKPDGGPLVALPGEGTIDTSTNAPVTSTFKAPAGAKVISPLSTLIEAGLSEAQVKAVFNIGDGISVLDYDPVDAARDDADPSDALSYKAASVMVANLMDVGAGLIDGAKGGVASADYSAALASALVRQIQTSGSATDFTSEDVMKAVLQDAMAQSGLQNTSAFTDLIAVTSGKLADGNFLLNAAATDVSGTAGLERIAQIEQVMQTTVAETVQSIASSGGTVDADFRALDIEDEADAAEVPVQSGFQTLDFESSSTVLTGFFSANVSFVEQQDSNRLVRFIKSAGSGNEKNAGVTVSEFTEGSLKTVAPIDFSEGHTTLGMWVHSAKAGTKVRLEVADSASGGYPYDANWVHVEEITTQAGWEYLRFDFSEPSSRFIANDGRGGYVGTTGLNFGATYDMLSVFFDLGVAKVSAETYYFDSLGFAVANPGAAPESIAYTLVDAVPVGYTLAFAEEFGGSISGDTEKSSPNDDYWDLETGRGPNGDGWGNGEQQVYGNSLDNAFVQGGALHIIASKTGETITSARLKSDLPDLDAYGYMEVRARMPAESGAWPAIWLLGQGVWPDTGEIDIAEWSSRYFNDTKIQAALHFLGDDNKTTLTYGNTSFKQETTLSGSVEEFHTYQLWWTPTSIRIGVDGNINNAYFEYTKPANADATTWPFDSPMDVILNLAIGGTLGGTVPASDFTYQMLVDYVRVYQRAGTGPTVERVVSFEANDSTGYALGGDQDFGKAASSLEAVPPEGATGQAAKVIKNVDAATWAGTTFLTLAEGELVDTEHHTVTMKVWSPDAGTVVRLKLEDKANNTHTVETDSLTTVAGGWQTLSFDFFNQANGTAAFNDSYNYNRANLFFDFGSVGTGKTYYFDEVSFMAPVEPPVVDPAVTVSFEANDSTGYALGGDQDFGKAASSLEAVPPEGATGQAAKVIKNVDAATWAGTTFLTLAEGELVDTEHHTVTMKVWSPDAGTVVRLKLEDKANNTHTVETDSLTTVAGGWQTLSFDFFNQANGTAAFNDSYNYNRANLFFDFGSVGTGKTYYFDEVSFMAPVEPPVVDPAVTVSFEANDSTGYALGGDQDFGKAASSLEAAPPEGATGQAAKVIKNVDAATWAGTTFLTLAEGELVDTEHHTVTMKVWSPDAGTVVRLKLEDKANNTHTVETDALTTVAGGWQTLSFDFFNQANGTAAFNDSYNYNRANLFFDFGSVGTGKTYYFDEVSFMAPVEPPVVDPAVMVSFEANDSSGYTLGGNLDFGGNVSSLQVAPPEGGTGQAAKVIKNVDAATWAGTTFLTLAEGELVDTEHHTVTMKVWSPDAGTVVRLKLEDKANNTHTVETDALTTVAGGWQTLTFDFLNEATNGGNPTAEFNDSYDFNRASVFFDNGHVGTGKTYYFDDVNFHAVL